MTIMQNYFPHPSNMRMRQEVLTLRVKEGLNGYGVYMMLLEMLRDEDNRTLKFDVEVLSFAIGTFDTDMIKRVIQDYGLFTITSEGSFSSIWLEKSMEEFDTKKAALKEAGKKGSMARWHKKESSEPDSQAIAMTSEANSQAIAMPSEANGNIMKYNITKSNTTKSRSKLLGKQFMGIDGETLISLCLEESRPYTDIEIESTRAKSPQGYTPYFIMEMCQEWGISTKITDIIVRWCDNGKVGNPNYTFLNQLSRNMKQTQFKPKYPSEYILLQCIDFAG